MVGVAKKYYKRCYYCNYRVLRGAQSEYSFHRFPRDPITNKQWKKFCKLSDIDKVSDLFLCSKHFKASDFIVMKSEQPGNGGARLNRDAVPTIRKAATPPPPEKRPIEPVHLEVIADSPADPSDVELSIPTQIVVKTTGPPEPPTLASLIEDIQDFSDAPELSDQDQVQIPIEMPAFPDVCELTEQAQFFTEAPDFPDAAAVALADQVLVAETETFPTAADLPNQIQFLSETEQAFADAQELLREEARRPKCVRRKYAVPRYMGDIMSSDLATPKGAMRTLEFARATVAIQRKKLIAMQQKYRRLLKKVDCCKEIIADLQQQNVLPEDIANNLVKLLRPLCCV